MTTEAIGHEPLPLNIGPLLTPGQYYWSHLSSQLPFHTFILKEEIRILFWVDLSS